MPEGPQFDLSAGEIDLSAGLVDEQPTSLDRVRSLLNAQNQIQRMPSPAEIQGLDLSSAPSATLSGLKEFGGGFLDLLRGAAPQPETAGDVGAMVLGGPAGLPAKKLIEAIPGLAGGARQVPSAIGDIARSPDPLGTLAAGVPRVGGQAAAAVTLQKLTKIAESKLAPPSRQAVTQELTKAANPAPQDVPAFKANLEKNLDNIVSYAQENNIPLTSRQNLAAAARGAAENHPYRSLVIEPNKALEADIPMGSEGLYRGGTTLPNRATVAQLDARLSTINDTLSPRLQKGGAGSMTAQAAIGAEQAASLNAEAVMIRNLLADTLSKKFGVKPGVIRNMRGEYGQMKNVAEEFEFAHNEAMSKQFAAEQKPLNIRSAKEKVMEAPLNPRYWGMENPADVMVRNALNRYKTAGGGGY